MISDVFQIEFRGRSFFAPNPTRRDHIQSLMKVRGKFYEERFLDYLNENCPKNGIVLDCGANVGNHSLFFAGIMGKSVIAFEPVKANRDILKETITLNELVDHVTIEPFALGAKEGLVVLEQAIANNFGSFQAVAVDEESKDAVRMTTIDGYLTDSGLDQTPVALVKIDVEGFEEHVLDGAHETFKKYLPIVALEVSTVSGFERLKEVLEPLGYVPIAVFNHTPTVVFASGDGHRSRLGRIFRRIAKYEKRTAQ